MLTLALCSHSSGLAGAERMLLNLALLLERSGAVHPVLLAPGEGALAQAARRQGLHSEIYPAPPWYLLLPRSMDDYRRGVEECCRTLQQMLVDLNSDAVLINTLTSVPAMLAAVELELPSLLWVHGVIDSMLLPERSSEFAVPHDELLLHAATRVIALPNYTGDFCARVMRRTNLDIIPNWTPVDPHFTVPAEKYRSRRIACLNTFDPHKGHATLLRAAALLKAGNVPFELHLYGDGAILDETRRRAEALGLQDHVRFQGRTNHVNEVYDQALCVVNPADAEPFPMTLLEPMARKTPVVATRCGGPSEIVVDGQSGYLVDRGDAAALADRLRALLESPELAQRLGEGGHARICERYREAAARAAFVPVIEQAAADFRGYEPAVKTLAKFYRLWLAPPGSGPVTRETDTAWTARVTRMAKRGLRRLLHFRAGRVEG
jgi:glycosyltransferase involved in cell wall biosynthesis